MNSTDAKLALQEKALSIFLQETGENPTLDGLVLAFRALWGNVQRSAEAATQYFLEGPKEREATPLDVFLDVTGDNPTFDVLVCAFKVLRAEVGRAPCSDAAPFVVAGKKSARHGTRARASV
jgi:hypothetical protein